MGCRVKRRRGCASALPLAPSCPGLTRLRAEAALRTLAPSNPSAGEGPGIHDEVPRRKGLRKATIAERHHGLPGQVYTRVGQRPDPVARQ